MISVVIIDFRSSQLVDSCVDSLIAGTLVPDEIIIVDNEGRGLPRAHSRSVAPVVRTITVPGNPGYSASCNVGAAAARGDILLFLNADVTLSRDCLRRCVQTLGSAPDIGIVTCRLVRPDGSLDHACHRGLPTPTSSIAYKVGLHRLFPGSRHLARYTMGWLDPSGEHDIEACSGAFVLIGRAVLDQARGWDERYRFYAEDLDLCLKVRENGWRVRYVGTVDATHLKGAFSRHTVPDRKLDPAQLSVKRSVRREIARSHRLFFEEHMRTLSPFPVRVLMSVLLGLQELRTAAADRLART